MEEFSRNRTFNERPMLYGTVGTLLGALLALRLSAALLWVLGAACLLLGVVLLRRGRALFALPLLMGLLLLRGFLTPPVHVPAGRYYVTGTVVNLPEQKQGKTEVALGHVTIAGRRVPEGMTLLMPQEKTVGYGTVLRGWVQVTPSEHASASGWQVICYEGEVAGSLVMEAGHGDPLYGLALRWRQNLEERADALFGEQAGLAKGMLLGDKRDVPSEDYLSYRRSGMLHLLTVSGLHVGVVCGGLIGLVRGKRSWLRLLLSLSLMILFCLLSGLSASSLRAAIMLHCLYIGRFSGRQPDPFSDLGCALTATLMLNPRFLLTAGFCLSFTAVYGIICLATPLSRLMGADKSGLGQSLGAACGVLVGTAPVLSFFGSAIPWISVPLALLVIPAAPVFLLPGWVCVLLYPLMPGVCRLLALLPKGVLAYYDWITDLVRLEGISLGTPPWPAILLWYVGMLLVSDLFLPNEKKPPILGWGLMIGAVLIWMLS